MGSSESNASWDQISAVQADLEQSQVVVPICVSRLDGRRHELSPRAMRFAEALSFDDRWSRITDARNRGLAA
jgi:hypothetical protein